MIAREQRRKDAGLGGMYADNRKGNCSPESCTELTPGRVIDVYWHHPAARKKG